MIGLSTASLAVRGVERDRTNGFNHSLCLQSIYFEVNSCQFSTCMMNSVLLKKIIKLLRSAIVLAAIIFHQIIKVEFHFIDE